MKTVRITFEEIKRSKLIKGVCQKCGKRRERIIVVTQTINPFNKNSDGTVKTYGQVYQSVEDILNNKIAKMEKNFICATCFNNLSWPMEWPENRKEVRQMADPKKLTMAQLKEAVEAGTIEDGDVIEVVAEEAAS